MLFKPLNLSQFLSASGKLSSQKSKNAIRPFTRVVRARIERKRKKETEYSVEGEGFCSSLSPLRTTDRSGRGIAAGKSVNETSTRTCISEFITIVGQASGASLRRGECQSQANKTEQEGT